jgi:hypothetical protein
VTVRSIIRDIQVEVRGDDLQPDRAADLIAKLSSLYGNVLDEVRMAEMMFNAVMRAYVNEGHPVNKAESLAKSTPEYERWREARDLEKLTTQMISSLKAMLRMKAEEARLAH